MLTVLLVDKDKSLDKLHKEVFTLLNIDLYVCTSEKECFHLLRNKYSKMNLPIIVFSDYFDNYKNENV